MSLKGYATGSRTDGPSPGERARPACGKAVPTTRRCGCAPPAGCAGSDTEGGKNTDPETVAFPKSKTRPRSWATAFGCHGGKPSHSSNGRPRRSFPPFPFKPFASIHVALPHYDALDGIPSHDTFNRLFAASDPNTFLDCFLHWTQGSRRAVPREIVDLDGGARRRALNMKENLKHIVSEWAESNNPVLQIRNPKRPRAGPSFRFGLDLRGGQLFASHFRHLVGAGVDARPHLVRQRVHVRDPAGLAF